jgi:DNA-binding NtrC family response regulator
MKNPAKIYLVDDDELIVATLSRVLKGDGYEVRSAGRARDIVSKIKAFSPELVLLDIRLPDQSGIEILGDLMKQEIRTQVIMLSADDTAETAVKAMKLGAVDYLTKPFNVEEVKIVVRNIIQKGQLQREVDYLRKVHSEFFDREIIGDSGPVRGVKAKIEKMSEAKVSTILMTGESGTGKELFARYAHRLTRDNENSGVLPFIRVNCAALPENLLESELFGHVKGSFTDAKTDKKGLFEMAHGGTILLDEIGDMKLNLQGKLLRVLEERAVRPVGAGAELPVDVTVIATTNRNLSEAVETGEFRMDLFFRLSTFYLHVPPLRERAGDIPDLARHFLSFFATRYNKKGIKSFSPDAEKALVSYAWPGNIRELRNLVERLVVLDNDEVIRPEQLPGWLTSPASVQKRASGEAFTLPEKGVRLEEVEKNFILQALDRTKYNKAQAAKLLHISYDTLRYQVKKLGLE